MKKLIIGAVAFLAAVSVNAAMVKWNSGVVFGPSDSSGTLVASSTYKLADSATASMYVFAIANATDFAKVQSDGVWATYGDKLGTATASTSSLSSSKFAALTTDGYAASSTAYAAILFTYTDGAGKEGLFLRGGHQTAALPDPEKPGTAGAVHCISVSSS